MRTGSMNHPAISVVVCTHNRAALLGQALESLVRQTLNPARYEIIVVNNCSTDDTTGTVEQFQVLKNIAVLRSVDEPALGLGHARNRGWQMAAAEYVAFMDDDARADPHWLERTVDLLERYAAKPLAVGGQIRPFYISPKPAWYKDEYEVRSWGQTARRLITGESFSGSNMIVSKTALHQVKGFDVGIGMRGERVSVGEETVLFQKIWELLGDQAVMVYAPELIVYHTVGRQKMRPRYHLNRWFVAGQVACRLEGPFSFRNRLARLRNNVTAIRALVKSALEQRHLFPDYRSWMVERLGPVALEIGRLLAGLGLHVPISRHNGSPDESPSRSNAHRWSFR
jgi:glucosyl-dolichyl phosphate glucuronosyltransferase